MLIKTSHFRSAQIAQRGILNGWEGLAVTSKVFSRESRCSDVAVKLFRHLYAPMSGGGDPHMRRTIWVVLVESINQDRVFLVIWL